MNTQPHIVAVANQKGGVCKTATVLGLLAAISNAGGHALAVDLDPQGNLTTGMGFEVSESTPTANDILREYKEGTLLDAVTSSPWENIDLVPANLDLAHRDTDGAPDVPYRLREALSGVDLSGYDVVLIDCPPSLGRLLMNALFAATRLVLATDATVDGVRGIENILDTTRFVTKQVNPGLDIAAIVVGRRERASEQDYREAELREVYKGLVATTVIPKRAAWADAHGSGKPIYSFTSSGARSLQYAYTDLAEELSMIERR